MSLWDVVAAPFNAVADVATDIYNEVTGGSGKKASPDKPQDTGTSTAASTPSAGSTTSSTDVGKAIATALAEARRAEMQAMAEARRAEAQLRADVAIRESNNMLRAEKDSNLTMRYGIMKNSQDAQFQVLAWLTNQLESLDTKSQIFMKDAEVRLAQIGSDYDIQKRQLRLEDRELDFREHEIDRARMVGSDGLLST